MAAVLFPIQTNTDIPGQQLIGRKVLVGVFPVQRFGIAPFCWTVFLPSAVIPACREADADTHRISEQKNKGRP